LKEEAQKRRERIDEIKRKKLEELSSLVTRTRGSTMAAFPICSRGSALQPQTQASTMPPSTS
ncbi:hypothetical protein G5576_002278, partial [Homo sapiens]